MSAFIDTDRARFGVGPICSTLGVSASAYYERASGHLSARALEGERLLDAGALRGLARDGAPLARL